METREGPRRSCGGDLRDREPAPRMGCRLDGGAPHTTSVVFRGTGRVTEVDRVLTADGAATRRAGDRRCGRSRARPPNSAWTWSSSLATRWPGSAPAAGQRRRERPAHGRAPVRRPAATLAGLLAAWGRGAGRSRCSRWGLAAGRVTSPAATLGGVVAQVGAAQLADGRAIHGADGGVNGDALEIAANGADWKGEAPGRLDSGKVAGGLRLEDATTIPADPGPVPAALPGVVAAFTGFNGYLKLLRGDGAWMGSSSGRERWSICGFRRAVRRHRRAEGAPGRASDRGEPSADGGGALLDSDIMPLGGAPLAGVDESRSSAWRQAFEHGEAGIFGIPLDQVIQWMVNNQVAQQAPEEEPVESSQWS